MKLFDWWCCYMKLFDWWWCYMKLFEIWCFYMKLFDSLFPFASYSILLLHSYRPEVLLWYTFVWMEAMILCSYYYRMGHTLTWKIRWARYKLIYRRCNEKYSHSITAAAVHDMTYLYHWCKQSGDTALLRASERGNQHIVKLLITNKAYLNIKNQVCLIPTHTWLICTKRMSQKYHTTT